MARAKHGAMGLGAPLLPGAASTATTGATIFHSDENFSTSIFDAVSGEAKAGTTVRFEGAPADTGRKISQDESDDGMATGAIPPPRGARADPKGVVAAGIDAMPAGLAVTAKGRLAVALFQDAKARGRAASACPSNASRRTT